MILELESDRLHTSKSQYAYKKGFSTTQCTFNIVETIKYYNYNASSVYLVLLDASKAFDRLHFGKLFTELCNRKVHPLIIRFLLVSYVRGVKGKMGNGELGFFKLGERGIGGF